MNELTESTREFARNLNADIRDDAAEGRAHGTEVECFAARVLDLFAEAGVLEEPEVCVRGGRLGRGHWEIAGWAFPSSEEEDQSQLSVLAVAFDDSPTPQPAQGVELRRRFELATHFIKEMLDGRADDLEPAADAAALGRIIHERRRKLRKIEVLLATDGLTQRLREIESEWVGDIEIACSIWDIERLSRLSDPRQEEIEIDILAVLGGKGIPALRVPEEDPAYDAYLCVVPGQLLFHAYETYGQRLLELNVRSFLSVTGKVNKGIRATIHDQPSRFFPYNNGLALTARRVESRVSPEGGIEITRVVGLQVVNGGQTTASIHRAWKLDGAVAQVKQVFVQGKLVVVTTAEDDTDAFVDLVRSISKHANSQNAVKGDDLEANQPWHVAFEKLSREVWTPDARSQWYYERARGSYAVSKIKVGTTQARKAEFERQWPRAQLITKTDIAKSMNAWSLHPEIVSLGGQKNFAHFMRVLDEQVQRPHLDEAEFKRIVGRVILFRDTAKIVHELKDRIPAYRANVVAYLVAYLSFRMPFGLDFEKVWERQELPPAIRSVMREWAEPVFNRIVVSAEGRNVTEWCKKVDCWRAVQSLELDAGTDLSRFASENGRAMPVGLIEADDALAIAECRRLSSDEWERLLQWTVRQKSPSWLQGIVQTLRLYSLDGWQRQPSPKQAKHAYKQIAKWRAAEA